MKQNSIDQSKSTGGSPSQTQEEWAELERELREPVAEPDDALCDRIMAEVAESDRSRDETRTRFAWRWKLSWGTVGALGAAAAVVILVWLQPWGDALRTSTENGGMASTSRAGQQDPGATANLAAIQKEQELLVEDTRKIASFLQANLRL